MLNIELKDQKIIKTYPDVVEMFDLSEITDIATEVMKLSKVIGSKKVTVVEELKNLSPRFKGSSNQRTILVKESLKAGQVVLYDLEQPYY